MVRIMKIIDYRATTAILLFLLALLFSLPNLVIAMVLMLLISAFWRQSGCWRTGSQREESDCV